eukprot:UN04389
MGRTALWSLEKEFASQHEVPLGSLQLVENASLKQYGVQFHPEVDLTVNGKDMLANFLFKIAGCSPSFTIEDRESKAIAEIRETVGSKKVLCLVSGGVDSSVCAALLRKALPTDQILAVHIDHGFMRHEESASVHKALSNVGLDCEVLSVAKEFAESTTDIDGKQTPQLQNAITARSEAENHRRHLHARF